MNKKLFIMPALAVTLLSLSSCSNPTTFDNSKLVIGLEVNYPPFNFPATSQNEYTLKVSNVANLYCDGYDIQIAKRLSEELNVEVEIMKLPWESLVSDLQFGTINAVIAGMTDTEERRKSIDFTDEYYRSELVLVVNKEVADSYTSTLNEEQFSTLANAKVFVSQVSTVTNNVLDTFASNYGAIHASPLDSFALAATDVSTGSAFAMTAELPVAESIVSSFTNLGIIHIDQNILGAAQSELGVSIGIQKGNTELKNKINEVLAKISKDERNQIMKEALTRSINVG